MADFRLEHFTPYRLARAAQILSDEFAAVYKSRFGLSMPEWRVLAHVSDTGGASVRDIEARVGLEKSKVSRAAARLVARGLLSKDSSASDRRLVSLALTPAGVALMADLLPLANAYQAQLDARFGAALTELDTALTQILSDGAITEMQQD